MSDDVRHRYDPGKEIPQWFWQCIDAARDDPAFFDTLSDDELVDFANQMGETQSYFYHHPFPPPNANSENALMECAAWVISQGLDYFLSVWNSPEKFWHLHDERSYRDNGPDFEFAADQAWEQRHGTEIPKQ